MLAPDQSRILVAEDDRDVRTLLVRKLQRAGYAVYPAANGDEAFDLAVEHRPDLCIIDVLMPGRNGLDLVRDLRRMDTTRSIPIVVVSGHAGEPDVLRGFDAGADRYLKKPVSLPKLVDCIQELLVAGRKE